MDDADERLWRKELAIKNIFKKISSPEDILSIGTPKIWQRVPRRAFLSSNNARIGSRIWFRFH
jgi:hypothetical protein